MLAKARSSRLFASAAASSSAAAAQAPAAQLSAAEISKRQAHALERLQYGITLRRPKIVLAALSKANVSTVQKLTPNQAASILSLAISLQKQDVGSVRARMNFVLAKLTDAGVTPPADAVDRETVATMMLTRNMMQAVVKALPKLKEGDAEMRNIVMKGLAWNGCGRTAARMIMGLPRDDVSQIREDTVVAVLQSLLRELAVAEELFAFVTTANPAFLQSEAVYAAMASNYARNKNLSLATKYDAKTKDFTTKTGRQRGFSSFSALIEAHAALLQPGDADQTYRDMRLAGIRVPASVYTKLIRVHGLTGNMTKAVRYFTKRDDSLAPATVDINDVKTPVSRFQPTRDMHAALVMSYAVNGEILGAFRALGSAGPFELFKAADRDFTKALASNFINMEQVSNAETAESGAKIIADVIRDFVAAASDVAKSNEAFEAAAGIYIVEGLTLLADPESLLGQTTWVSATKIGSADPEKCRSIALELAKLLLSSDSPVSFKVNVTDKQEKAQKKTAANENSVKAKSKKFTMQIFAQTGNLQAAKACLESEELFVSHGMIRMYLEAVVQAVERGVCTVEEGIDATKIAMEKIQTSTNFETSGDYIDAIVRVSKGDAGAKTWMEGRTLKEVVQLWADNGGLPSWRHDALAAFVEAHGIRQLI
ncbi:hypothetical protein HDU84_009241 [Entophlyctis sp. JEL0112]|nr:hypothetical protein HDU84_009241 [Entophlyctis sp. JEL0112]